MASKATSGQGFQQHHFLFYIFRWDKGENPVPTSQAKRLQVRLAGLWRRYQENKESIYYGTETVDHIGDPGAER
jgi:hypothetical protein